MRLPADLPPLPRRPQDGNKHSMGRLLVIGGSPGLLGAPLLSARAALRSGTGLVTVAVPESLHGEASLEKTDEAMSAPFADGGAGILVAEAIGDLLTAGRNADAWVIGPGLGRQQQTTGALGELFAAIDAPILVDADGLWHLAADRAMLRALDEKTVLTPHAGEMARLREALGQPEDTDEEMCRRFLEEVPAVVALKGPLTLIASSEGNWRNPTGNAGMATAGSGDVLAGVIGALLARGDSPTVATRRGCWLHGRAGDIAAERLGEESLIAGDIIEALPEAFKDHGPAPR